MVGLEVPTDTITNHHPMLPRFLSNPAASPSHIITRRYYNTPLAIRRENITPTLQPRSLDGMHDWPQWARIALIAGLGLAALLLVILAAVLCSRRRQRAGMTTVSQKDAFASSSASSASASMSTLSQHPVSQGPYGGGFVADAGAAHLARPTQAMAPRQPPPPRPLASPNPMTGMYDVPLETSRGHGPPPSDPFGLGRRAAGGGGVQDTRAIGTSSMRARAGLRPEESPSQDHSAFSPWESPTKKKFKF